MKIDEHALDRAQAMRVPMALVRAAARHSKDAKSVAVCVSVAPFRVRDREQWQESNVIAAIVRNDRLVTFLATRKAQVHEKHLAVDVVVWAE